MTILKEQLFSELRLRGYRVVHATDKKQGWQKDSDRPVYVNLKSVSGKSVMVVHPDVNAPQLACEDEGSSCGNTWFHSSNLKLYPKRQHGGMNAISYGWPITFDSEAAMKSFMTRLEMETSAG